VSIHGPSRAPPLPLLTGQAAKRAEQRRRSTLPRCAALSHDGDQCTRNGRILALGPADPRRLCGQHAKKKRLRLVPL
jgi:hypothetical protein